MAKGIIRAVLALSILAGLASAQIRTGFYADGAGYTVRVEVSDTNGAGTPGVEVTVTDAGGSSAVSGTQASGSTNVSPSASSFPPTTTPRGAEEVRGHGGKVQKKNAQGQWVNMRKAKTPRKRLQRLEPTLFGPGNEGTSLPPESL